MRVPIAVFLVCAVLLIGGMLLAPFAEGLGIGLAVLGIVVLGVFLIYVNVRAWRERQGDAYSPGKASRGAHRHAEAKRRRR